jgi:hypothetical protein
MLQLLLIFGPWPFVSVQPLSRHHAIYSRHVAMMRPLYPDDDSIGYWWLKFLSKSWSVLKHPHVETFDNHEGTWGPRPTFILNMDPWALKLALDLINDEFGETVLLIASSLAVGGPQSFEELRAQLVLNKPVSSATGQIWLAHRVSDA